MTSVSGSVSDSMVDSIADGGDLKSVYIEEIVDEQFGKPHVFGQVSVNMPATHKKFEKENVQSDSKPSQKDSSQCCVLGLKENSQKEPFGVKHQWLSVLFNNNNESR